jgi:hypothetical protein
MKRANNRYYSNAYGRFMTPDPYAASGGPSDPQSWNRYAYTRGDPVNRFDPRGTDDSGAGDGGDGDDWGNPFTCDPDSIFDASIPCGAPSSITYGSPYDYAIAFAQAAAAAAAVQTALSNIKCTISLDYRPVTQKGFLSNFNHSYIVVSYSSTPFSAFSEVLEGLPTNYSSPYGNLTSNILSVNIDGTVNGDALDNTLSDPSTGSVSGSIQVCTQVAELEQEAINYPTNIPYKPLPLDPGTGQNSNTYAYLLLTGAGLDLGTPPSAPGFGPILTPPVHHPFRRP